MKKEDIKKVFDGESVARVPVGFWHHFIPHSEMGQIPGSAALQQKYLDMNRQWQEDLDPDFVKIMTDGYLMMPLNIGNATADDIANVEPTDFNAFLEGSVRIAHGCREVYGPDKFLLFNIFSPFITVLSACKKVYKTEAHAALAKMIEEEPDKILAGVSKVSEYLTKVALACVGEDGADGIYLCTRQCKMTEDAVRKIINPTEIRIFEAVNKVSTYNAAHICDFDGPQTNIRLYAEYPCKVFNWAVHTEKLSMHDGKEIFGGRTVLGGFDMNKTGILFTGDQAQITAETHRILEDTGSKGFILGADCTVDPGIDVAHLRWVRQAAEE